MSIAERAEASVSKTSTAEGFVNNALASSMEPVARSSLAFACFQVYAIARAPELFITHSRQS